MARRPTPPKPETPAQRNARIFREAAASGEPVFVIRAKDILAVDALLAYGELYGHLGVAGQDPAFVVALAELEADMRQWRNAHMAQLKVPDVRPVGDVS